MIELFYSPGACSLATQIALQEAGAHYQPRRIDTAAGEQRTPEYLAINPHGRVPALRVEGRVITENPAILSYVGEAFPEAALMPESAADRAYVRQMLSFFSGTVHSAFAHVFRPERFGPPEAADAIKAAASTSLDGYFAEINALFAASEWVATTGFSVADGYPFVFYRWASKMGVDVRAHAAWSRHVWRMLDRRGVETALEIEGLKRTDWISVEG